jgi:outer membrane protein TolC
MQRDIENALMQYKDDLLQLGKLSYMKIESNDRLLPLMIEEQISFVKKFEYTVEAKILEKKIAQKKEEIRLKFRQQLPSLSLYSNYYLYSSHPTEFEYPVLHMSQKSWNVGFSVRFNIFEGFKNSAADAQLHLELQNLQNQLTQTKHNFEYEQQSKVTKIDELKLLHNKEENLLQENNNKLVMIMRLRENQRVDMLRELNTKYELLQRKLNLADREVDINFQKVSLTITNRGVKQCTQH